jgi:hypothetical protein
MAIGKLSTLEARQSALGGRMVIEKLANQVDAVRGRRNPDLEYPQST